MGQYDLTRCSVSEQAKNDAAVVTQVAELLGLRTAVPAEPAPSPAEIETTHDST